MTIQDSEITLDSQSVTRSALIKRVTEKLRHASPRDVETAIYHILNSMVSTLKHSGRIEIRGFGAFSVRYRPPRKAHNPKTREKVAALGKYVTYFRPGKEIKARLNTSHKASRQEEAIETEDMFS